MSKIVRTRRHTTIELGKTVDNELLKLLRFHLNRCLAHVPGQHFQIHRVGDASTTRRDDPHTNANGCKTVPDTVEIQQILQGGSLHLPGLEVGKDPPCRGRAAVRSSVSPAVAE